MRDPKGEDRSEDVSCPARPSAQELRELVSTRAYSLTYPSGCTSGWVRRASQAATYSYQATKWGSNGLLSPSSHLCRSCGHAMARSRSWELRAEPMTRGSEGE